MRLSLGYALINWWERYIVHGPGDVQGEPWGPVSQEWGLHLLRAYELRSDGRRIIRRDFLSRPKGWAKSEKAGGLCVLEGLAPVRFDHWAQRGEKSSWGYKYEPGEPVGKSVVGPEILTVATEEGQAGHTFDNVVMMLGHIADKFGHEFPGLDVGLTRCFLPGRGEIIPISAKARSKDGGKSTFVVFDETHLYETDELRRLHRTILRNLGKRVEGEPWSLETSTMYRPGMDSVAEQTHEFARQIADGRRKDDSLLFDHRQGPEEFDFDSDAELRKALAVGYGDEASRMDGFKRITAEIRDPQSDEADSRRYWLNQVVRSVEQAFDVRRWAELTSTRTVPVRTGGGRHSDQELLVLGFKGTRFEDSAVIATHVESGYQWPLGIWERPVEATSDWEVDENLIDQAVEQAFSDYDVWRLYADPPYWETAVDRWAGRHGGKRVVRWWTNRSKPMAYAVRAYAGAIRSGDVTHSGDSEFRRHIANARKRPTKMLDEDGRPLTLLQREHHASQNRINGAVAAVLSWEARGDAVATGAHRSRGPAELVTF